MSYGTEPSDLTTVIPTGGENSNDNEYSFIFGGEGYATTEFPVSLTNQFTLYTQLKTNSVSEWAGIISSERIGENEETDFQMNLTGEKKSYIRIEIRGDDDNEHKWYNAITTPVNDGLWHAVYFSFDVEEEGDQISVYVDGIEQQLVPENNASQDIITSFNIEKNFTFWYI